MGWLVVLRWPWLSPVVGVVVVAVVGEWWPAGLWWVLGALALAGAVAAGVLWRAGRDCDRGHQS